MTDIASNPAFPLERAASWISDWRRRGGGFWVREGDEGVEVQLARNVVSTPDSDDAFKAECEEMERFLLINPALKMAVMVLARDAWEKSQVRALDTDHMTKQ